MNIAKQIKKNIYIFHVFVVDSNSQLMIEKIIVDGKRALAICSHLVCVMIIILFRNAW